MEGRGCQPPLCLIIAMYGWLAIVAALYPRNEFWEKLVCPAYKKRAYTQRNFTYIENEEADWPAHDNATCLPWCRDVCRHFCNSGAVPGFSQRLLLLESLTHTARPNISIPANTTTDNVIRLVRQQTSNCCEDSRYATCDRLLSSTASQPPQRQVRPRSLACSNVEALW